MEDDIINLIRAELGISGPFEDAESVPLGGTKLMVTTDMLSEGDDFPQGMPPHAIGWVSVAANLSDLAAVGAAPLGLVMAWGFPRPEDERIREIAKGMKECASFHKTRILGGDVNRLDRLVISGTAFGSAGNPLRRGSARAGDRILVSGKLGASSAAYITYWEKREPDGRIMERFHRPLIKLGLMHELAGKGLVNAAIDDSDGLSPSIHHICRESRAGAVLEYEKIPLFEGIEKYTNAKYPSALDLANIGNDYEVFMTVAEENLDEVLKMGRRHKAELYDIGRITEKGVLIERGGKREAFPRTGFSHF
jgi:thiamine-monophosphate kinase